MKKYSSVFIYIAIIIFIGGSILGIYLGYKKPKITTTHDFNCGYYRFQTNYFPWDTYQQYVCLPHENEIESFNYKNTVIIIGVSFIISSFLALASRFFKEDKDKDDYFSLSDTYNHFYD